MIEPYSDDAENRGLPFWTQEELDDFVKKANGLGISGRHSCHRRPRQSHGARRLRKGATGQAFATAQSRRTCADHRARRHSALCRARRHRIDADDARHQRHEHGGGSRRTRQDPRRLRLAASARFRRRHRQRFGFPGRIIQSVSRPVRRRHAAGPRRRARGWLVRRPGADARRSTALLHAGRGVCGAGRRIASAASSRASGPTSS